MANIMKVNSPAVVNCVGLTKIYQTGTVALCSIFHGKRALTMNATERIDKQIAELTDWRGEMFVRLRKLIREADPDITEAWKWNTPVWSHQGLVCALAAFKRVLTMNFFQSAFLEDPHSHFNAGLDTKTTRSIDFHEGDTVNESTLKDLIRAAVA
jgi:hypothetical protein